MPILDNSLLKAAPTQTIQFALEPVHLAINSLILINKSEPLSGLSDWVMQTAVALSPERLFKNQVILEGLNPAITPTRSWSSFPAYLRYLESADPGALVQDLFDHYETMPCQNPGREFDLDAVLASADAYLNYLTERFPDYSIHEEAERAAYELLVNPPAMQAEIVEHLRTMWNDYLQDEWERQRAMLQDCITAFRQIDFGGMSHLEVAREVIGQPLPEWWEDQLASWPEEKRLIFVPSAHLGPYLGKFHNEETFWVLFGARLPAGSDIHAPDLSRAEMLVRLNALADDTRLRILRLIKEEGEQCSQDIMSRLDLSQSATSRHLKQLSATGYLKERRLDGAKCYNLNPERIQDTLNALTHYLLG